MNKVSCFVLTGGPCAGKSTGISVLEQELTYRGYRVFILEELATMMIRSGITPAVIGNEAFQKLIIKITLKREKDYRKYSAKMDKPVVILCDRGIMDGEAYTGKQEFMKLLAMQDISIASAFGRYTGIMCLVTAAKGAEEYYTLENNTARSESKEDAIRLDELVQNAWVGHTHIRVIPNEIDGKQISFNEKIDKLKKEVLSCLGIPVPLEIEYKYLISMPDLEMLVDKYKAVKVSIVQTYLMNKDKGIEERVRQRGIDGEYTFYHTFKKNKTSLVREEREEIISQKEYISLLQRADTNYRQIVKDRYVFLSGDRYYELDVYPHMKDTAILEVEVESEDEKVSLPEWIELIADVTNDESFKNKRMAYR